MCLIFPIKGNELPYVCSNFRTVNGYFKAPTTAPQYFVAIKTGDFDLIKASGTVEQFKTKFWFGEGKEILVRSPSLHRIRYQYPFCQIEDLLYGHVRKCTRWHPGPGWVESRLATGHVSIEVEKPKAVLLPGGGYKASHHFKFFCRKLNKGDLTLVNREKFGIDYSETNLWLDLIDCGLRCELK